MTAAIPPALTEGRVREIVREELTELFRRAFRMPERVYDFQQGASYTADGLSQFIDSCRMSTGVGQASHVIDELPAVDHVGRDRQVADVGGPVLGFADHDSSPSFDVGSESVGEGGRPGAVEDAPAPGRAGGGAS